VGAVAVRLNLAQGPDEGSGMSLIQRSDPVELQRRELVAIQEELMELREELIEQWARLRVRVLPRCAGRRRWWRWWAW
jgi:hypothetical protein